MERIAAAMREMDLFLASSDSFLDLQESKLLFEKQQDLRILLAKPLNKKLKPAAEYRDLLDLQSEYKQKSTAFLSLVMKHNERAAQEKLADAYRTVGAVEGRQLDHQQILCILKEAHSHLVIAGAGTGKTTTIVGKIKFLLKKELCKPSDILVLSFTNASASEMRERIQKEVGYDIEASTFHKLGLNIIKSCEGVVPKITKIQLRSYIKTQLEQLLTSPQYLQLFTTYLLYHSVAAKSEFDFNTESEYYAYLESNPPTTLKNERVKSYGELDIANFLSQNGIPYMYEAEYPIDTRTSEYGQYYPDFFLPEHGLYIEYFGIKKGGEVAPYFQGKNGKSATTVYQESMEWKRRLHEAQGTKMIACYAYEKLSGELLENLAAQLKDHLVSFRPNTAKDLLDELITAQKSLLDGFIELAETLINLIKSNGYSMQQARNHVVASSNYSRTDSLLLDLVEPIFASYSYALSKCGEIDFHDMISNAIRYVTQQKYQHAYQYVIVDEYQDISKSRYLLLKSMRDSKNFKLFCVGDDWQSIYRFSGSDVGYILHFETFWGISEISRIETTYRFPQTLINISSGFVMKNPNQVRKAIRGNQADTVFPLGEINSYNEFGLAEFLSVKLLDLPQSSSVFFIGRYSFDIDYIKNHQNFNCDYQNATGYVRVTFIRRRDLRISFLTAHRSKGLQADYVFILNNKKSRMGFPSKIQDAPILDLFLESNDDFPDAEERRLFYVAMTRAKKKVVLLTLCNRKSEFVEELHAVYDAEMKREAFTCPLCGGSLRKINGKNGEFFGCSNYRVSGCKYTRSIYKRG